MQCLHQKNPKFVLNIKYKKKVIKNSEKIETKKVSVPACERISYEGVPTRKNHYLIFRLFILSSKFPAI